ncbi:MAG: LCP family protein [Clostridia bacterium]|nr:LCP family protein [Clostridia bacterium]
MKDKHIDKEDIEDRRGNKRKKKKIWKKVILVILLILLIGIGWFSYRTHKNGGGLSGMLATAVGHDENTKKNLKEIKVLILGISTDIESQLTDTIMVASYNPNTQKANLLSIPRDTYTGKYTSKASASQKINSLYGINEDPQDTLDAINEITGLDIQYYVIVRTEALIELVDAIGGVEFNVPIDMKYDDPTQDLHINLKAGTQMIDGEKAEHLLRFRHNNDGTSYSTEYGDNDLGRMRTQRDFISATLQQTLKPGNILKVGEILEIAIENVETNLELSYVKDYIPYAVEFSIENLQTATLPGTTPDLKETNNVSIFVVDKVETKKLIDSMFNTSNITEAEETEETNTISDNTLAIDKTNNLEIKVELLNGSGDKSNLEKAKNMLEKAGYNVKKTGNTSSISKTIITNKKEVSDESLKEIKQTLGVGSISTNKSSTSLVDITIVIGKDFE